MEKRNERSSANTIVIESEAKNAPVTPPRNARGIWMTMVLAVEPKIAGMSSLSEAPVVSPNAASAPCSSFLLEK